jgi:hypothetical protein
MVGAAPAGAEPADQVLGRRAPVRVLGHRRANQRPQRFLELVQLRLPGGDPVGQDVDLFQVAGRTERRPAGAGKDQEATPGEDIRRLAHLGILVELLGRHVRRRSEPHILRGEPAAVIERPGDPEVDYARSGPPQDHVAGLEVTVDDPDGVDRHQSQGNLLTELLHLVGRHGAALAHRLLQRRSLDVLGDEEGTPVVVPEVEHRGDVRLPDPAGVGGLALEPLAEALVGGELRADELDGDLAAAVATRQVHHRHPAAAKRREHLVLADPRRRVAGVESLLGQGRPRSAN